MRFRNSPAPPSCWCNARRTGTNVLRAVFSHVTSVKRDNYCRKEVILLYDVLTISDYIIRRCSNEGHTVSNLKLQKLLYFVQAEFLVVTGKPCFREKIVAWDFGPVIPEVYHEFCIFGSAHIPVCVASAPGLSKETAELIDGIVFTCLPFSSSQLVEITQHQNPWICAYAKGYGTEITNESILNFFAE